MSQKLPSVFKGLGGSTSHKAGFEGALALQQQAAAPRGLATLRKNVQAALDKDTPSACYQLKQLHQACQNNPAKQAAYEDGMCAGLIRQHYMRPAEEVLHLLDHVQSFHQQVPRLLARTLGQIAAAADQAASATSPDPRALNDFDMFCKLILRRPAWLQAAVYTPVLRELGPQTRRLAATHPPLLALLPTARHTPSPELW